MNNEEMFDSFFGVETAEGQEEKENPFGNSYQATYYNDLVTLFNEVSMEPEDTLVDFGCGLGRVLFYVNSRHYCNTVGIEYDEALYEKLLANAKSYQSKFLDQEDRMLFYNQSAENYDIRPEDNYFYLFNPFSGEVFEKVIENILKSVKEHPRDVELIIYYPTYEYNRVMRNNKLFIQKKIIKCMAYADDPDEKIVVYHLSKAFAGMIK